MNFGKHHDVSISRRKGMSIAFILILRAATLKKSVFSLAFSATVVKIVNSIINIIQAHSIRKCANGKEKELRPL